MEQILAYCGLSCDTCPVHLATLQKNKALKRTMRESIAEECFKRYGMKVSADDITDCDGCAANTGRLFSGCLSCEIRNCAISKNVESCAFCSSYICEKLRKQFLMEPGAQKRLEELRESACL